MQSFMGNVNVFCFFKDVNGVFCVSVCVYILAGYIFSTLRAVLR